MMADLNFIAQADETIRVESATLLVGRISANDALGAVFAVDTRVSYLFSRLHLLDIAIQMQQLEKALL